MITVNELKKGLGSKSTLLISNITDEDLQELITQQSNVIMDILNIAPEGNPPLLKKICSDFCKYELYQREARQDVPEAIERQYNNGMKLLDKINKREITFGAEETEESTEISFSAKSVYFGTNL